VLVIALLAALALGSAPTAPDSATPVPTVTLSGP
jgi:hypothetical protein